MSLIKALLVGLPWIIPALAIANSTSGPALLGCKPGVEAVTVQDQIWTCSKLAQILKVVPISATEGGHWMFVGEIKTRKEIEKRVGTELPADVIPMGSIVHTDKEGNELCVVFDANYLDFPSDGRTKPRNPQLSREGFIQMVIQGDSLEKGKLRTSADFGNAFREFNIYDRVWIYAKPKGKAYQALGWRHIDGDRYEKSDLKDVSKFSKSCNACSGWLCSSDEKMACFTRFNDTGFDQVHILNREEDLTYFRSLGVQDGNLQDLTDGKTWGTWVNNGGKWTFKKEQSPQE